jgi:hypothetical protein
MIDGYLGQSAQNLGGAVYTSLAFSKRIADLELD